VSYHLTITEQPSYLHATGTGTHTPQNAARFLKEAYEACVQRGYSDLLLEMNQSGPSLDMTSIVEVITERSADGLKLRKIAYVDTSSRDPDRKRGQAMDAGGLGRNTIGHSLLAPKRRKP
jgi:hypothetical protein